MSRWPTRLLGELIEERSDRLGQAVAVVYSVTNERGFVRSLDLFDKQVFSPDTRNYKHVAFENLAYNPSRINVGSIAICNDPNGGAVSPMYTIVRCKKGLLPRYLLHFLKSELGQLQIRHRCEGAVRFQLKFRDLSLIPIRVPSLKEQERLVRLLDEADALRKFRAEADGRLNALIPSLFHDMFGDETSLPLVELGEIISSGPQNGLYKHSSYYGEGCPILRIDAFYNGEIEDVASLKNVKVTPEELATYVLQENDIVVNRVNSVEYLGKSALIPSLSEPTVFESNMMRFSLSRDAIEPVYAIQALQTTKVRQQILARAKHSINQSSINQQDVKGIRIPLPPLTLQRQFSKRVSEVRALKDPQTQSRERLDRLFQSIVHRAFAGEL